MPNCIPVLLGLELGSDAAQSAVLLYSGILTSLVMVAWAIGGVGFGFVIDKCGRSRGLMFTVLIFSLCTALSAASPNLALYFVFRLFAAIGTGGEWSAGATFVAEVVPEQRRVELGALLHTSGQVGVFAGALVNSQIAGHAVKDPVVSWRWVLAFGILPALVVMIMRLFVKEPERWVALQRRLQQAKEPESSGLHSESQTSERVPQHDLDVSVSSSEPSPDYLKVSPIEESDAIRLTDLRPSDSSGAVAESSAPADQSALPTTAREQFFALFAAGQRTKTLSGLFTCLISLLSLWTVQTFLPIIAQGLADQYSKDNSYSDDDKHALIENWKSTILVVFNAGGFCGSVTNALLSKRFSRRTVLGFYYLLAVCAVTILYGVEIDPVARIYLQCLVGFPALGSFAVFGVYLTELFPTHLRGTGAALCYNSGRVIAAFGPLIVGSVSSQGSASLDGAMRAVFISGFVPLIGFLGLPLVVETFNRPLLD